MAHPQEDDFFSEETCKLCDIPERVDIPTLVRVTEGIYSTEDCSTFSQGDIIKIDGHETIDLVVAHLAVWSGGRYQEYGDQIYVPLSYKGRLRVCPIHGAGHTYTSVEELMTFFPKFVTVEKKLSFTHKGESSVLQSGDTLELLRLVGCEKTGFRALRARHNNKSELILPKGLTGSFKTQTIDVDYTVNDVMKFKMPQCVKFIGQDISLFTSKDIQEAAANIQHYDGYILLSGRTKTRTVLLGHYKSMSKDPSTRFCRRSAVILPMDNPDIANIEVQVPMYMDTDDYEIFVLNHFSESDVSQPVEGLLYIDFSKNAGVIFSQDSKNNPPVVPPRTDRMHSSSSSACVTSSTPPPRPPRTDRPPQQQPDTQTAGPTVRHVMSPYENHSGKLKPKPKRKSDSESSHAGDVGKEASKSGGSSKPAGKKPTKAVAPLQQDKEEYSGDGSEFVIADIFNNFGDIADNQDETAEPDSEMSYMNDPNQKKKHHKVKGIMHKLKKTFSSLSMDKDHDSSSLSIPPSPEAVTEHVYDYVDDDTPARGSADNSAQQQKTAVVQPFQQFQQQGSKSPENRLKSMSVNELQACFDRCAIESLAQIVRINKLDGEMFSALSDDDLTKDPFYLNNLDIKKVRKIQTGWAPNL